MRSYDDTALLATCWRTDTKTLSAASLKTAFNEELELVEEQQGRRLSKADKQSLLDELKISLLSNVLKQTELTQMCFDLSRGLLFIDSFDLSYLKTSEQMRITATQWLLNRQFPSGTDS